MFGKIVSPVKYGYCWVYLLVKFPWFKRHIFLDSQDMDANMMHVAGILCFDLETARSKAKSNAGRSNTSSITSWEFLARVLVYTLDFFWLEHLKITPNWKWNHLPNLIFRDVSKSADWCWLEVDKSLLLDLLDDIFEVSRSWRIFIRGSNAQVQNYILEVILNMNEYDIFEKDGKGKRCLVYFFWGGMYPWQSLFLFLSLSLYIYICIYIYISINFFFPVFFFGWVSVKVDVDFANLWIFQQLRCRSPEFKDPHHFRHLVMLHPTAHLLHHQVRLRHKGTKSLVLLGNKAILQWHHHRSIFAERKKGWKKRGFKICAWRLDFFLVCFFFSFADVFFGAINNIWVYAEASVGKSQGGSRECMYNNLTHTRLHFGSSPGKWWLEHDSFPFGDPVTFQGLWL